MSDPGTVPPSPAPSTIPSIRSLLITPQFAVFITVTVIMVGMILLMVLVGIPAEIKDIFNTGFGVVVTAWGAAVAYFIGSSSGSKAKDDALNTARVVVSP